MSDHWVTAAASTGEHDGRVFIACRCGWAGVVKSTQAWDQHRLIMDGVERQAPRPRLGYPARSPENAPDAP